MLKKFKGKKYGMILKIDLKKAYDRLRSDFLKDMLIEVGFPNSLISVILNCVFSSSFRILWNGLITEEFEPTKGVR